MQGRSKTVLLSGCLLFHDKQKFQHFLKNFGNEFLININLDHEKQIVEKNLQPLKIKIPNKSKAKSEKEKPACQAKGKKRKNNEFENEEEEENKGFHIDGDMAKFLEHLDQHTRDLFQNTKEILDPNLPIIYNSLATVKSFISLLGKIILKIWHEIDPIFGEITLKCKGCLLHCPRTGT